MALDQKALESLSGAQQIIVMQHLKQEAAAWLLGVTSRTLRDHSGEFERAADDRYDARNVFAVGLSNGLLKVDPVELSPDEQEQCIRTAELLYAEVSFAVMRLTRELDEKYGDRGLAACVRLIRETWADDFGITEHEPPMPKEADLRQMIESEVRNRYVGSADARLQRGVECESCGKVRRGRKWVMSKATEHCLQGICPECHRIQQEQRTRRKKRRGDNVAVFAAALAEDDDE